MLILSLSLFALAFAVLYLANKYRYAERLPEDEYSLTCFKRWLDEEMQRHANNHNRKLLEIIQNTQTIMNQVETLNAKIASLEEAVNLEQQQIAELLATNAGVVASLQQANADLAAVNAQLVAQLSEALTPEQLAEITGKLDTIQADIAGTIADVPVEEEPIEGGDETPAEPTEEV